MTFQTATAMGGLPYMTPLRITWGGHSAIAYKRDFGFGGGPIDGLPRVIDLWWQFAERARHPVRGRAVVRAGADRAAARRPAPATCWAQARGDAATRPARADRPDRRRRATRPRARRAAAGGVPVTAGPRARLLPDGLAAAPAAAPAAVKGIIAAGNQIVGKPYVYGGGHGLPLSEIAPAYDCSSSVEHLLYGGAAAAGRLRRGVGHARVLRRCPAPAVG